MSQNKPSTSSRPLDWAALVREAWGPAYYEPDVALEFSNGRQFKSTDTQRGGIYSGTSS